MQCSIFKICDNVEKTHQDLYFAFIAIITTHRYSVLCQKSVHVKTHASCGYINKESIWLITELIIKLIRVITTYFASLHCDNLGSGPVLRIFRQTMSSFWVLSYYYLWSCLMGRCKANSFNKSGLVQ